MSESLQSKLDRVSRPPPTPWPRLRFSRGARFWLGVALLAAAFAGAFMQPTNPEPLVETGPRQLAWWLYPFERNATRHLPRIDADLNDIFIVRQSSDIWIAGDGGFLAVSHDRGRSWQQVDLSRVRAGQIGSAPQQTSWWAPRDADAAEEKGRRPATILPPAENAPPLEKAPPVESKLAPNAQQRRVAPTSTPPPPKATPTPSPEPEEKPLGKRNIEPPDLKDVSFRAVWFADPSRGWIAGSDGSALATEDGGVNWVRLELGGRPLTDVTSAGERTWFTTVDGDVFEIRSSEPGVRRVRTAEGPLRTVSFSADGKVGWPVAPKIGSWVTVNGGENWIPPSIAPTGDALSYVDYDDVRVDPSGKRAWALAGSYVVPLSRQGEKWSAEASPELERGPYTSLAVNDAGTTIWCVGHDVAVSSSGGKSWTYAQLPPGTDLRGAAVAADGHAIWAVGRDGAIVSIDDAGVVTARVGSGRGSLQAIAFADEGSSGLVVGDAGLVASTSDGGERWKVEAAPSSGQNRVVHILAGGREAVVAGSGIVWGNLAEQGWNWGEEWRSNDSSGPASISEYVVFPGRGDSPGNMTQWAVTLDGEIWNFERGIWSRTYARRPVGDELTLQSLCFAPGGRRGVAVGYNPSISDGPGQTLVTRDGGESWAPAQQPRTAQLLSVVMRSASDGWSVGGRGTVLRTKDGGDTWVAVDLGAGSALLQQITFTSDGTRGWIVGSGGTILATRDGGESWQKQESGIETSLSSIHVNPDGERAWIAGEDGIILRTANGGASWKKVSYAKVAPAPWFFVVALLIVGFVIAPALAGGNGGEKTEEAKATIAAVAVSDRPLEPGQPDRLNTRGLARGLARFLGNEATQARLTIGIMGSWGTGKSSIMNETRAELGRYGFYSAWFNAWHHQTEENLLASLFETIRREALPAFWKLDLEGIRFRTKLLWIRLRRQWLPWFFFVLLIAFAAGHITGAKNSIGYLQILLTKLLEWLPFVTAPQGNGAVQDAPRLVAVIALLGSARLVWNGLSTFGVSPSLVVSRLTGQMHIGDLRANPGLRQQFKGVFGDVVEALHPRPLAIFIDDLDRCLPKRTLGILELVNFVMTAGDCYVLIGMDRDRVEGCVGMAFKDVASFLDEDATADTPAEERQNARQYARQYLDKLINIEVCVPQMQPSDARNLVKSEEPAATPEPGRLLAGLRWCRRFAPLATVLAVLVGVWIAGNSIPRLLVESVPVPTAAPTPRAMNVDELIREIQSPEERERLIGLAKIFVLYPQEAARILSGLSEEKKASLAQIQASAQTDEVKQLLTAILLAGTEQASALLTMAKPGPSPKIGGRVSYFSGTPTPLPRAIAPAGASPVGARRTGRVLAGEDALPNKWLWAFGVAFAAILLLSLRLLGEPLPPERDSPKFADALGRWIALVHQSTPTPRALKRFVNRVRYYAMREQKPEERATRGERLRRWLGLSPSRGVPPATTAKRPIPEDVLVALSAIQHSHPEWLADRGLWSDPSAFLRSAKPALPATFLAEVLQDVEADIARYEVQFQALAAGVTVH